MVITIDCYGIISICCCLGINSYNGITRYDVVSSRGGALVQWLMLPAWKVEDRGLEPHSGLQVSNKQNVSSPLSREGSIMWRTSVTER